MPAWAHKAFDLLRSQCVCATCGLPIYGVAKTPPSRGNARKCKGMGCRHGHAWSTHRRCMVNAWVFWVLDTLEGHAVSLLCLISPHSGLCLLDFSTHGLCLLDFSTLWPVPVGWSIGCVWLPGVPFCKWPLMCHFCGLVHRLCVAAWRASVNGLDVPTPAHAIRAPSSLPHPFPARCHW